MTATLWTQGGNLLVNGSGELILCEVCPCPPTGEYVINCTDDYVVKDALHVTLTFSGVSQTFALVMSVMSGIKHWTLDLGASPWKPCGDGVFDVSFLDFYCNSYASPPFNRLHQAITGHNAAGLLITDFMEFDGPATVVSANPIHLTGGGIDLAAPYAVGTCNGTDSILSWELGF